VLYAWDPIAKKERWRIAGAANGPFAGGSLATAGNLVFSSVNDRLMFFRADTGEKLGEVEAGTTQLGPPMTFMIDGKQYIAVAGGPAGGGGGRGAGGTAGAAAPAPRPAHVLLYALDGKAPLPGATQ
jgi:quinohemoprotein ethanol dehydrogenase